MSGHHYVWRRDGRAPFDDRRGVVSNEDGRVVDPATGKPVFGVYVAGWIERGLPAPRHQREVPHDTVRSSPVKGRAALEALISDSQPDAVSFKEWSVLDRAERARGKESGRPRVRLVNLKELVYVAKGRG